MSCTFPSTRDTRLAATAALGACRSRLAAAGVDVGQELGCGGQGCAYDAGAGPDGRPSVLKVTCSAQEALFAAWLMRQYDVPAMLPRFYGSWDLECSQSKTPYAVWREALGDDDAGEVGEILDWGLLHMERRAIGELERLEFADDPVVQDAIGLLKWAKSHSVRIADVAFNFGVRYNDTLVLRDLGFATIHDPEAERPRPGTLRGLVRDIRRHGLRFAPAESLGV